MKMRVAFDVSDIPDYKFGPHRVLWWGMRGFCALEGTAFVLAAAAHFYLLFLNPQWPLSAEPPSLVWSTLFTIVLVASVWPNELAKYAARDFDERRVKILLVILIAAGLVALVFRALEFTSLNVRWDQNAYGSLTYLLLGLHTLHIATDVSDSVVLLAILHLKGTTPRRFTDVEDNALYWNFVVGAWIPLYLLIYWTPRWT